MHKKKELYLERHFSPVSRLEGIRTLFKVYQIDVKSTFLNDILEKEVCIDQLEGFVDVNNKNMVCRLHKALYGLKQAPGAWDERLHKYLMKIRFERTDDNNNLYIKIEKGKGIFLFEFFFDNIIFGGQDALCKAFTNEMK